MQNAIKAIPTMSTNQVSRGMAKTVVTAAGMTGTAIGAYHVKNLVSDATDNQIMGVCAGVAMILVGAATVTFINQKIDHTFGQSTPPLVIDVASDAQMFIKEPTFDLDDLEGT